MPGFVLSGILNLPGFKNFAAFPEIVAYGLLIYELELSNFLNLKDVYEFVLSILYL